MTELKKGWQLVKFALSFLALFGVVACAQTIPTQTHIGLSTSQQVSTSNWGNCGSTACAGGAGNSASFTMTTGVASPSVSGASLQLSFSSPASGNNGLFYMKPGACDTCTWILYDFQWYVSSSAANHEADSFIFNKTNGNWDAMFGHQCNTTTGHWQYANQTSSWTDTSMSCAALTAGAWHHVIFYDWYLPTDTACTGGVPCEHFGTVTVDGVTASWGGATMPATTLNSGFSAVYGCQVQEDSNANATVTMYVDNYNCWVGK